MTLTFLTDALTALSTRRDRSSTLHMTDLESVYAEICLVSTLRQTFFFFFLTVTENLVLSVGLNRC